MPVHSHAQSRGIKAREYLLQESAVGKKVNGELPEASCNPNTGREKAHVGTCLRAKGWQEPPECGTREADAAETRINACTQPFPALPGMVKKNTAGAPA